MADLAAMLRTAVYQALTTLHERPRPAASFSSLSPQFKRPTADRTSMVPRSIPEGSFLTAHVDTGPF